MNKLGLYILAFCLLFVSCEQSEHSSDRFEWTSVINLLENGNCENWTNGLTGLYHYLEGWSLRDHHGSIFQEYDKVYEGMYAVRMSSPQTGITASVSQKIKVLSGHNLRIRFHYYIEKTCTGTKPRMHCYFSEEGAGTISDDVLSTFFDEGTWGIIRGGGYGLSYFPLNYGEWELFDYTIQVPAIADYFVFEIHSYAGTTMYVDDCWVVDIGMK